MQVTAPAVDNLPRPPLAMVPTSKRVVLLAAPVLVLATMYPTFQVLAALTSPRVGYFLGFVAYWLGWCLLVPIWALGWAGVRDLFWTPRPFVGRSVWVAVACLALPLALSGSTALPRVLPFATPLIVVASLVIALVNATGEEILWRGLYARVFPGQLFLGYVWPAVGFAVWHVAPQSLRANAMPGGVVSLVVVAGVIGLLWAWVVHYGGSIRWTALAHILFNLSGLGALVYLGPLALP